MTTLCVTEPVGSSIIEYGLPICLLFIIACGIIYFLCKIDYQKQILRGIEQEEIKK